MIQLLKTLFVKITFYGQQLWSKKGAQLSNSISNYGNAIAKGSTNVNLNPSSLDSISGMDNLQSLGICSQLNRFEIH